MSKKDSYTFIIVDDSTQQFSIYENIVSDEFLNDAVVKAQKEGRQIRSFTTEMTCQEAIDEYIAKGYKLTERHII